MIPVRNIDAKYHRRRLVALVWIAATVTMVVQIVNAVNEGE